MSVYTTVTEPQLQNFLQSYDLGELAEFEGITDGIENTNYFVTTDHGEYVLTLFEILTMEELPFFVELMAFLNEHNIPSAHPVMNRQHSYLGELNDRPAILMQRLHGMSVDQPTVSQCEAIGRVLGDLHLRGSYFSMHYDNSRGEIWRNKTGQQLMPLLSSEDAKLLQDELKEYAQHNMKQLPSGVIHADLFRDNVLFEGEQLTGLLDFYNACIDSFLYDLAITVNDWCLAENGRVDFDFAYALCDAYSRERPLTAEEKNAWPMMLRISAMRFWLSRLWSLHYPREGDLTFQKNPDDFKQILVARNEEQHLLRELW